jgi:hypothetical protein
MYVSIFTQDADADTENSSERGATIADAPQHVCELSVFIGSEMPLQFGF